MYCSGLIMASIFFPLVLAIRVSKEIFHSFPLVFISKFGLESFNGIFPLSYQYHKNHFFKKKERNFLCQIVNNQVTLQISIRLRKKVNPVHRNDSLHFNIQFDLSSNFLEFVQYSLASNLIYRSPSITVNSQCSKIPSPGPCRALIVKVFFNQETQVCQLIYAV